MGSYVCTFRVPVHLKLTYFLIFQQLKIHVINIVKMGDLTVMPTKSDSDVILCSQLLSKTLTCTLHLSIRESIDHLCINPSLCI